MPDVGGDCNGFVQAGHRDNRRVDPVTDAGYQAGVCWRRYGHSIKRLLGAVPRRSEAPLLTVSGRHSDDGLVGWVGGVVGGRYLSNKGSVEIGRWGGLGKTGVMLDLEEGG